MLKGEETQPDDEDNKESAKKELAEMNKRYQEGVMEIKKKITE